MVPRINKDLKRLAVEERIECLDLFPLFKENNSNSMRIELTSDGLHIKEEGYEIWTKALKKIL